MNNQTQECCRRFGPSLWDGKTVEWKDKKFIKDKVFTVFNIPLNFGGVMTRATRKIEAAGLTMLDGLCLSECTSLWNTDVFLAVEKEVAGAENVQMSGKFFCKVYEGSFQDTGKWFADFDKYVKEKGFTVSKVYSWYTTCPNCAEKYGKNYVVLLGKI